MSQHDMNIENQGFPAFRSDLNNALAALASTSAGATAPSTTFAQQLWYDSTANLLKMRNTDNDAWITLAYFDQTNDEWQIRSAVIQAVDSAGVTIKNDGGTTLIEAKDDGSVVFRTDDVTVDSSGNLLVGKTSSGTQNTADGFELRQDGYLFVTKSSDTPAYFNRRTTDGNIAEFRKDGTTVGSIGAHSGDLNIGTGDVNVRFFDAAPSIIPRKTGDANGDDFIDLGESGNRFKDLYLSGGVYLGGTGSANYLDDYEEGTWTPALASGTINVTHAVYTKIGNTVFVAVRIEDPSDTTSSTEVEISGLPFASVSGNASVNALFYRYFTHSCTDLIAYKGAGNIVLYQSFSNNQNWVSLKHSNFNASADFYFSISYQTDA